MNRINFVDIPEKVKTTSVSFTRGGLITPLNKYTVDAVITDNRGYFELPIVRGFDKDFICIKDVDIFSDKDASHPSPVFTLYLFSSIPTTQADNQLLNLSYNDMINSKAIEIDDYAIVNSPLHLFTNNMNYYMKLINLSTIYAILQTSVEYVPNAYENFLIQITYT